MKHTILYLILASILCGGCLVRPSDLPPTETLIPLEELVAAALVETRQAEQEIFSPAPPYSPLQLAQLLAPGDALDGEWQPSTIYDLSQPYPGLPDWCGEYYGSCWGPFRDNRAAYGAEVQFLLNGQHLGEAALLYYQGPEMVRNIFGAFQDNWSEINENIDSQTNKVWMHYFN